MKNKKFASNSSPLQIDNLCVHYGSMQVLNNVSLRIEPGDFLGIIGPNGGGKTTLVKAVLGLIPISGGKIHLFGQLPNKGRRYCGYVPQQSEFDHSFPITVQEVVLTGRIQGGLKPFHRYSQQDQKLVAEILHKTGIYKLRNRQIGGLSGGEFQKMLIARALATRPHLLILDEPTASVDVNSRTQIYSLLKDLNQEMTIILVTHDLAAISTHVRSLACLNTTLHYHGAPQLNQTIIEEMYGCPVELIAHGVPHRVLQEHDLQDNHQSYEGDES